MDGIVEHHEVSPDAMQGSSKLVVSGHDLSALMDLDHLAACPIRPSARMNAWWQSSRNTPHSACPARSSRCRRLICPYPPSGSRRRRAPTSATSGSWPRSRLCLLHHARPATGHEPGVLGAADQIRLPQPALNVNMDSWTNVENLSFRYEPQQLRHSRRVHPGRHDWASHRRYPSHRSHRSIRRSERSCRCHSRSHS